jgi:endonuclease/exonuclease/phosphatase family metal-dependent hydrolase
VLGPEGLLRGPARPSSWPLTWGQRPARRPALLAIDHVLADRTCAVLTTSTHLLPGSDHRALYAELRLPER